MIDPNAVSTIRVGELSPEPFSLTDNVPHEVGTELKRGTIEDLATFISAFIGSTDGVGFRAISVTDGQTLPTTTQQEFILVGKGTYYNVVGGSTIICTEELNAIVSNGSYWFIGVEIPINVELAGITQFIRDGFINTTPSEDTVHEALALKSNVADSENIANKQNNLTPDGTGTKYPTVDAVNTKVSNIDNTSDINKPISTAQQTALNLKENAFSKNTAFNKNFGTTSGTVVEGGTLGSSAYINADISSTANTVVQRTNDGLDMVKAGYFEMNKVGVDAVGLSDFVTTGGGAVLRRSSIGAAQIALGLGSNAYNSTAYLPLSGGTLTGIVTAPTAPAGTNTTQIATTAFVQENSRPYKVYTALLTQTGTNAPVATVLENTLGGTVVWSYVSIGQYRGTLTGAFLENKTVVFLTNVYGKYFLTGGRENDNSVMIGTQAPNGGSTNGDLSNSSIEIRVYL